MIVPFDPARGAVERAWVAFARELWNPYQYTRNTSRKGGGLTVRDAREELAAAGRLEPVVLTVPAPAVS